MTDAAIVLLVAVLAFVVYQERLIEPTPMDGLVRAQIQRIPPDERLASGSVDDMVIVWEADPAVWVSQACQRAGRNLTENEWGQYLSWKTPYDSGYKTCPQWSSGQ